jgi:hypothetical protein
MKGKPVVHLAYLILNLLNETTGKIFYIVLIGIKEGLYIKNGDK